MREAGDQGKGGETPDAADTEQSEHQTFPDNASISDLESELQTDQSVLGSPFDPSTGINKGPRLPLLLFPVPKFANIFLILLKSHCFGGPS